MEFLVEVIVLILGGALVGVLFWGVGVLKKYLELDPGGDVAESFEILAEHLVRAAMDEARRRGENLDVPETRWRVVNEVIDRLLDKAPKLLDFLGYDLDDLKEVAERIVRDQLNKVKDVNRAEKTGGSKK